MVKRVSADQLRESGAPITSADGRSVRFITPPAKPSPAPASTIPSASEAALAKLAEHSRGINESNAGLVRSLVLALSQINKPEQSGAREWDVTFKRSDEGLLTGMNLKRID